MKQIPAGVAGLRHQQGAVLIVALIILLVMTVLGVSNMQSSSLQMKMATNSQSRLSAFEAAELALAQVEDDLIYVESRVMSCDSNVNTCYDDTCAGGYCFHGAFSGTTIYDCELDADQAPVWEDKAFWYNDSKVQRANLSAGSELERPRYIVEFLCYVDANATSSCTAATDDPSQCAALYRVTALATSEDNKSKVMLQSTIKTSIN